MKQKSSQKVIGVLGAGQLALFLSLKAQKLGLKLLTLSSFKEDPAALKSILFKVIGSSSSETSSFFDSSRKKAVAKKTKRRSHIKTAPVKTAPADQTGRFHWIQGDPNKKEDLKIFLNQVDILTFESEFFSADLIKTCKEKTKVYPSLKNLSSIQDRLLQKKLLVRYTFPILDFKVWGGIDSKDSLSQNKRRSFQGQRMQKEALLQIWESWGPFVLKTRRGGYDGYGTFVVKNKTALFKLLNIPQALESSKTGKTQTKNRIKNTLKKSLPKTSFIAEPLLSFKRELALISARNQKGQIIFFPLVESFQKNSVCLWVKGPVEHLKLAGLKRKIRSFLTKIDYRGVIAFELFETESGLIVNELAPRVHNTGHYSLSALTEDQFTIHLKAISNQDLKTPRLLSKEFAMLNLLGEGSPQPLFQTKGKACSLIDQNQALKQKGFHLYWYGKKQSRPGRKMGHINCLGDRSLERLLQLKKQIKV